jgi:choline-sulfatase
VVEQIRKSGYETNLVGKWHIAPAPRECGFGKAPIWLQPGASQYMSPRLRHGLDALDDEQTSGHITDIFTAAAVSVIREARQPYLLWLTYNAPHTPWTASDRYRKLYQGRNAELAPPAHPKPAAGQRPAPGRGAAGGRLDGAFDWETYYAVISELDAGIGKVIDAVEQSGQWDNTLVLFIGDNGYLCGSKGLQGKVHPWEESIRIPFIVSGGLVPRAARSEAPVASIDVPATILDYAGVRSSHRLSGASLRAALNGGTFGRDAAFSSWNDGRPEALAIRQAVEPYRVARTPSHKYIVRESKKESLFDLKADPFEESNLISEPACAPVVKRLKDRLRARMKETSDSAIAWL